MSPDSEECHFYRHLAKLRGPLQGQCLSYEVLQVLREF